LVWFGLVWAGETIEEILTHEYTEAEVEEYFGELKSLLYKKKYQVGDILELDVGRFMVTGKEAEGVEGVVYGVVSLSNPEEPLVLKFPHVGEHSLAYHGEPYIKARKLIQKLNHDNIIKLKNSDSRFIIMEKADGSLYDLIMGLARGRAVRFTEAEAKYFFKMASKDVVAGMEYLHARGINFLDLKFQNVVYFIKNNRVRFELIDLGTSEYMEAPNPDELFNKLLPFAQGLAKSAAMLGFPELEEDLNTRIYSARNLEELKSALGIDGEPSEQEQILEMVVVEKIKRVTDSGGSWSSGGACP